MTALTLTQGWSQGRSLGRGCAVVAGGLFIGCLAWGRWIDLLTLAAFMPLSWAIAPRRMFAAAAVFAYYLGAARGLPYGAVVFFGASTPWYFGPALWIAACALLSMPWALLWTQRASPLGYAWRLALCFVLTGLPPLGLVGWAHPLTSAGVLFPSFGWAGLALTAALMWALCAARGAVRPAVVTIALLIVVTKFFNVVGTVDQPAPAGWVGKDTRYGGNQFDPLDGPNYFLRAYTINIDLMESTAAAAPSSVSVYPESLVGYWNGPTSSLWAGRSGELAARSATVLLGGLLNTQTPQVYENALIAVGAEAGVKYRQRVPIPIGMWNPFADHSARADWFADGIFELQGKKVAGLICYEQFLLWPVLLSASKHPEAFIGASNMYWSHGTSLPDIQRTALRAWGRLFGVPVVAATNGDES